MEKYLGLGVFLVIISTSLALECYVCKDQDSNKDKCLKSTIQCDQYDDACMTIIRYKVPPYWTPRSDRVPFVSKTCSKRQICESARYKMRTFCKRDWYDDWTCVECCQGDLCNYYVTLGSGTLQGSLFISLVTAMVVMIRNYW